MSAERAVAILPVQLVRIQQGDVDEVEVDLPVSSRRSFSGHMVDLAVAEVDTTHEAVVGGDAARLALQDAGPHAHLNEAGHLAGAQHQDWFALRSLLAERDQ